MRIFGNIILYKGIADLNVEVIDFDDKSIKYKVSNTPICQFDQHSRARIGVKFSDYKVAENPEYVLYTSLYEKMENDETMLSDFLRAIIKLETNRRATIIEDDYNLMSRSCSYTVVQDYNSLRGQMARRLKFCEEEFIVGLHWLLRDKMIQLGISPAQSYLPSCDKEGKCDYSTADYLSNAFGCLFAGCGRWPSHAEYASFNQSCTSKNMIEQQLKITL